MKTQTKDSDSDAGLTRELLLAKLPPVDRQYAQRMFDVLATLRGQEVGRELEHAVDGMLRVYARRLESLAMLTGEVELGVSREVVVLAKNIELAGQLEESGLRVSTLQDRLHRVFRGEPTKS